MGIRAAPRFSLTAFFFGLQFVQEAELLLHGFLGIVAVPIFSRNAQEEVGQRGHVADVLENPRRDVLGLVLVAVFPVRQGELDPEIRIPRRYLGRLGQHLDPELQAPMLLDLIRNDLEGVGGIRVGLLQFNIQALGLFEILAQHIRLGGFLKKLPGPGQISAAFERFGYALIGFGENLVMLEGSGEVFYGGGELAELELFEASQEKLFGHDFSLSQGLGRRGRNRRLRLGPLDRVADLPPQLIQAERFGDEVGGPGLDGFRQILLGQAGGHEQHGQGLDPLVRAHLLEQKKVCGSGVFPVQEGPCLRPRSGV